MGGRVLRSPSPKARFRAAAAYQLRASFQGSGDGVAGCEATAYTGVRFEVTEIRAGPASS